MSASLFPAVDLGRRPPRERARRKPAFRHPTPLYELTDHVCGKCLGRLLKLPTAKGEHRFRCADCGETGGTVGPLPASACACGVRLSGLGDDPRIGRDAGFRCIPNKNPNPLNPAEFVAGEI